MMIDLSRENTLTAYLKDLHTTSYDSKNNQYMTDSTYPAVDFDEVKDHYVFKDSDKSAKDMRSNDALVIFDAQKGLFIFIEFKNGDIQKNIEKEKIRTKISESLLIFNDIIGENLIFDRQNVNYILVYNKAKNPDFEAHRGSPLTKIGESIAAAAKEKYRIGGFSKYEAFFHDIKVINEEEFKGIATDLENSTYRF